VNLVPWTVHDGTYFALDFVWQSHSFRVRQYGVWGQHGKGVRNYMQHKKSTNFSFIIIFLPYFFNVRQKRLPSPNNNNNIRKPSERQKKIMNINIIFL